MSTHRPHARFTRLRLSPGFRWAVLAWLVAEFAVFALLVRAIGLGGTVLLGLATTVLGIVLLRRVGLETVRGLRRAAEGSRPPGGVLPDGLLAGAGALLLIIPGFLANAAGLALSAPSLRGQLLSRFGGGTGTGLPRRPARVDVIDLAPGDWTPVDRA